MDFEFDDDQLGLQASVAEVLAKECPPAYLRSVVDEGHDPTDLWQTLCSLDWPGLAIPEEHGGVGATAVELAIVVEQLGYVGDPTPFLATTTQFVPLVTAFGSAQQCQQLLGGVAGGEIIGSVVPDGVEASHAGDEWTLSGSASFVLDADRADELGVLAATPDGIHAFVVPASAARIQKTPAFDHAMHVAEVDLDGVSVGDDRRLGDAFDMARRDEALAPAVTGMALTTVGACQRAFELVIDYVRGREQFGVPIGSFQAVKGKTVDMYIAVERARALSYFAALAIAEGDERQTLAASMAKAAAGDAQTIVFRHSIQLFGGIGFTWENDLHLYLRRAKAGELLLGGATAHRARVGQALLGGRS